MSEHVIEKATPEDLLAIREWMREDERREVGGVFLCNWSLIERGQGAGELWVYRATPGAVPVAFLLGGIDPDILEVQSTYRRQGIGKKLVAHCLAFAEEKGEPLLWTECAPVSSTSFWRRMGFTITHRGHQVYAYRQQRWRRPLPKKALRVRVEIEFFQEERLYNPLVPPLQSDQLLGALVDESIELPRQVALHETALINRGDPVVRVSVNGQQIYLDKAKRETAEALGIRRCRHGFAVEVLTLPA